MVLFGSEIELERSAVVALVLFVKGGKFFSIFSATESNLESPQLYTSVLLARTLNKFTLVSLDGDMPESLERISLVSFREIKYFSLFCTAD